MLASLYIRYRQIQELCCNSQFVPRVAKCNTVSIYIACISIFGMLIVANFQEGNAFVIHIIGAQLCFGGAVIWQILQVSLSNRQTLRNFHKVTVYYYFI